MRTILRAAVIAIACLAPGLACAEESGHSVTFLRVPDSLKDTEIHISKLLLEKLKVNTTLEARKDNPEDLIVRAKFNPVKDRNIPAVIILIDTHLARRASDKKPISQIISIASIADIKLKQDKRGEILEWANTLNSQSVPMHVYLAGDRLTIGRNLYNAPEVPLPENAVTDSFTRLYRAWVSILAELRKRDFIEK